MPARHLRLAAAPLTLTLCFVLFLINDQRLSGSSVASGAEHGKPMPSLAGDAAVDHLKREGIYGRLMASIEADRFRITTASEEAKEDASGASFAAVNLAQHLRAEFSRDGVLLSPTQKNAQSKPAQKTARRDWQMRLRLRGYGYGDATQEVAARLTRTDGNRIETNYVARASERPALSEWHVNKREGIEHGFTIAERPGVNLAGEPLRVRMKVDGDLEARLVDGGGAVVFARRGGREMLRYDHLVVEDAMGRRLDARMEAEGGEVSIVVDEAGAVYPLAIDPLFTEVKKLTALGGMAGDRFGNSVSISSDTIVIGAYTEDPAQGAAYIFARNKDGADQWGLVKKLTGEGGQFGFSVGISNDTVIVGALSDESNKGAAYIYERNKDGADQWGQVKKLTAFDGVGADQFGFSVGISNDTVVVGALGDDTLRGSAYIFARNKDGADTWGLVKKLTADGGIQFDSFGISVAISSDTVVVGAFGDDSFKGAAYIFARNQGGVDNWGEVKMLTASDGEAPDTFGVSVGISSDTVVIGASDKGAAYIFARNQGGVNNWGEVKKLIASDGTENDFFGTSVGISSDRVVIGALAAGSSQGAAYIFARNEGGVDNWGEVEKLTASDGVADDQFGRSVSISFDTVVIGAYTDDSNKGSAYTFTIECDEWVERSKSTASGGMGNDQFGFSVGISSDTVVIGTPGADGIKGAAYIFARNQGGADQWSEVKKLIASDAAANDLFGYSVGISFDTVVVGANGEDGIKGAAYIFERNQGGPDNWGQVKKLTASDATADDLFGHTVGISFDTVVIGAPGADDDTGAAYIFARNQGGPDNWGQVKILLASDATGDAVFGRSVDISFDTVIVGASGDNSNQGAAYIFARNKDGVDNWGQVKKLTALDGVGNDQFGYSVAISSDTVVVGAFFDNLNQGAAYIFERNQGGPDSWGQVKKLTASDGAVLDQFGYSVSISSDTVVVGANNDASGKGAAYIFTRNKGGIDNWGEVLKLTASDAAANDAFGQAVGISSDTAVIGAPQDDFDKGSAYIFARECKPCAEMPAELPAGKAGIEYSQSVAATPAASYSYSLFDGMLPDGISLDSTTGLISGTTNIAGTYNFTIKAETQEGCVITQSYTLVIECPDITFDPMSLPDGSAGVEYSATVSAMPEGNYSYSLLNGTLPPGYSLDSMTGSISGTTNTTGSYNFTIKAQNEEGCVITQSYTLVIVCPEILLDSMSLPGGTAGTAYSQSLAAIPVGGYYYSLLTGMLPPGFSLNTTTGLISGLTKITGSYTFTIRAQNQNGCIATQSYTLVIECPEILLNPSSLANGAVGTTYSATLSAAPATTSYTFAVTSGSLPNGLSLNSTTGKIAGKPTKNGEFNFTITVKGFGSCSVSRTYKISIGSAACPMITLAALPGGTVGKVYSHVATASPAGSYSYSLTGGSLPPGVTFYNAFGLLYGYPTLAGTYQFTITATNSSNCMGSKMYSVTINGN